MFSLLMSSAYTPRNPSPSTKNEKAPPKGSAVRGSVGSAGGEACWGCWGSAMPAVKSRETERYRMFLSVITEESSGRFLPVTRWGGSQVPKRRREDRGL